tara:strand:- start:3179 stop:4861 length:1683 start_codon:yes stop_codon:yes gene_type:complete
MSNGKNTKDDFKNRIYVDLNLTTSDPLVDLMASKLIEISFETAPKRTRTSTNEQTKKALRALLANLIRVRWTGGAMVAISLMRNNYSPTNRFGIGYQAIKRAISLLELPQVLNGHEMEPLVTMYRGFQSPSGFKENTKLKLNDKSVIEWVQLLIIGTKFHSIDPSSILSAPTGSSILSREVEGLEIKRIMPITSTLNSVFGSFVQAAPICLLDDQRQQVRFERSVETDRMSELVSSYNRFLSQHKIGLFISDAELASILRTTQDKLIERARAGDFTHTKSQIMGWELTRLRRIFNRSSFECGGRHYGGFWQNLPRECRPFLTINGHPTVELDFHALHPTMIYHQHGRNLDGDPYEIEGLPTAYRSSAKKAFMAMVNSKPGARHLESLDQLSLPDGWTPVRLLRALEKKHEAIANVFRSDAGIKLQRFDSDIAEIVMRTMRVQHGALALPVHDSFIVTEDNEAKLASVMVAAYQAIVGASQVRVDRKKGIFEVLGDRAEKGSEARLLRALEAILDSDGSLDSESLSRISSKLTANHSTYLKSLLMNGSRSIKQGVFVDQTI